MTREEQIVDYFINNPESSMKEMESVLHISKSTIQRTLSSSRVKLIPIPSTGRIIGEQLEVNRLNGQRRGGRTTFAKYDHIKNADGTFNGLQPTGSKEDKEQVKRSDIVKIVITCVDTGMIFSMNELANYFSGLYQPGYIYRALTDPRVIEIFGENQAKNIINHLEYNQGTFYQKIGSLDLSLIDRISLADRQREVFLYRYNNGDIRSADEVSEHFGISRAAVLKLENKVITILERYMESKKEI